MYGHNFAFFDPNIWYNEEEIRKQIEQLNGCCILTGQETPGTNRKLKEDLFKKFASGDGIAGRKPYGFKTRMIHCTGWKRLEANRMFTLSGVTKRDFNSIFRRAFVWQVKSRFEDPHVRWRVSASETRGLTHLTTDAVSIRGALEHPFQGCMLGS